MVTARLATWTEVTTTMSIDDVDRLCTAHRIVVEAENTPPPETPSP